MGMKLWVLVGRLGMFWLVGLGSVIVRLMGMLLLRFSCSWLFLIVLVKVLVDRCIFVLVSSVLVFVLIVLLNMLSVCVFCV